jgi:rhamnopyranosyl-N-acetylglucosaminyl-diphospho-decaprenol beta-1,3/1,4-galactofuranosyltransferase
MNKFCAIIVTYNRKELLLQNLNMTLSQSIKPDLIYIIDNHGCDNTYEYLLDSKIDMKKIKYEYLNENIGGAGGFYTGLKKAYEDGNDWFILMDDDGRPMDNECFNNLFLIIRKLGLSENDSVLANSLVLFKDNLLSFGLHKMETTFEIEKSGKLIDGIVKDMTNPFNGTLISRKLIETIGYPNKDFFIRGDEVDYEERAIKSGANVFTVYGSKYYHPKNLKMRKKKFFGHEMYVCVDEPIKEYYSTRNRIYSLLHNNCNSKEAKKQIKFYLKKRYFCVLISKCKKIETIKAIKKAKKDAYKGNLGPIEL